MTESQTPHEGMKSIPTSSHSKINEDIVKNLDDVFVFASPREYREAINEIYHMYILHEYKNLPENFFDLASRIEFLMSFLKNCEEENQI